MDVSEPCPISVAGDMMNTVPSVDSITRAFHYGFFSRRCCRRRAVGGLRKSGHADDHCKRAPGRADHEPTAVACAIRTPRVPMAMPPVHARSIARTMRTYVPQRQIFVLM